MTSYHRPSTPEEKQQADQARQEKLAGLHRQLTDQVQQLADGDQWRNWLTIASRFHNYSFNNTQLLAAQRPDATRVAGYRLWQQLGRHVNKGEKGLAILAPVTRRARDDGTADQRSNPSDSVGGKEDLGERRIVGFTVTHVWDISQTSGDPLPEPPRPQLLAGQAPEGLWDRLVEQIHDAGYALDRVPPGDPRIGTANGVTYFQPRQIYIRDDVDDAQACKTASHELAHALSHSPENSSTRDCRGVIEVEAESVAYLVAAHHGLDTSGYTFAYVAAWAHTAATPDRTVADILAATGARVLDTARQIIDGTEQQLMDDPDGDRVDAVARRVAAGHQRTTEIRHAARNGAEPQPVPTTVAVGATRYVAPKTYYQGRHTVPPPAPALNRPGDPAVSRER